MEYGKVISHYKLDHSIVSKLKRIEIVNFSGAKYKCKRSKIQKVKKNIKICKINIHKSDITKNYFSTLPLKQKSLVTH